MDTDGGWASLGPLGSQLANIAPDFDPRSYGFKKLSDLVRAINTLEMKDAGGRLAVRKR
jgi:hypothetical protein